MLFYQKFLYIFYLALTILAIITPLNYSAWEYLPAFFIMWGGFIAFNFGSKKGLRKKVDDDKRKENKMNIDKILFFFVCFLIAFIPLYVKFYTGSLLTSLVMGFGASVSSESNYQEYQRYFAENSLGDFSLSKLPYILGFGVSKLLYYYFVFCYIGFQKKLNMRIVFLLFVMFLLFFLVGISRGTNFESFELLILILFSVLVRSKIINSLDFFPRKQMMIMILVVILIAFFFQFSKSLRSGGDMVTLGGGPTSTYTFDKTHWIVDLFPSVAALALGFSGYFSFGLYCTSEVCWKIWMSSVGGFIGAIVPYGGPLFSNLGNYRKDIEALGVDTGACWDPDCVSFIFLLGLPLFFVLIYNMGRIAASSYKRCVSNRDVGYCLLLFMIVYEMISFPIGNFLVISSSNKIVLLMIIAIVYFNKFRKYRIR